MNGAGNWLPGPGGPGGSGAIGGGGGAAPGLAGAGPGSGPIGSERAPGLASGIGTGGPGTTGGVSPGRPAIGSPGVDGRPSGFGGEVNTSIGPGYGPLCPNGPELGSRLAHGSGLPGVGNMPAAGAYEHGDPGATAGPGCS